MTQINFYMSRKDEADFLTYIRSKGGYLARVSQKEGVFSVEAAERFEFQPYSDLFVFLASVFPAHHLRDPKRKMRSLHGHTFWGPGIAYQPRGHREGGIVLARLWFEISEINFLPAPPWDGGPPPDTISRFGPSLKATNNFYQSMWRFIRKHYRSDGVWHGPDSDLQEEAGIPKFQMMTQHGPVPQHGFFCNCPKCADWKPDPNAPESGHWSDATAFEQLGLQKAK